MKIRVSKPSDKPQLQYICAKTARDKRFQENQTLVSLLYCDYYIDNQSEHCFVIADDNDLAVGYILCDIDYNNYKIAVKPYIKQAKKLSLKDYIGHVSETLYLNKIYTKYPCHMHIDILPEYQGKGYGKELIRTLQSHLKKLQIPTLRLTVGIDNPSAIGFYNHLGFEKVKNIFNNAYVLVVKNY